MSRAVLGFDTSNYTTSVALFDGESGCNVGKLLEVPEGGLGLRQSDALFQHVKRLPSLVQTLAGQQELNHIQEKYRMLHWDYLP